MPEEDRGRCDADYARRLHVLLAFLDQSGAAHRARVGRPVGNADRDDQHDQRYVAVRAARQDGARNAIDQERDQDCRKRQLDVGGAHDEGVEPSATIARDEPQADAQHDRERDRSDPDEQGDARAEHDGGEHIAALIVGAEQIFGLGALHAVGRCQRVGQVECGEVEGVMRRNPGREERRGEADGEHQRRHDRDRRAAESIREVRVPPAR